MLEERLLETAKEIQEGRGNNDKVVLMLVKAANEIAGLKTDLEIARVFNQRPDIRRSIDTLKAREEISLVFKK